jgi:hypothetical protein
MSSLCYQLVSTSTPIVPILIGDCDKANMLAAALSAEQIHVDAIKFPAVPIHKSRLRVQLNAGHTRAHIDHLVDVLDANQHLVEDRKCRVQVRPRITLPLVPAAPRQWAAAAFSTLARGKEATRLVFFSARNRAASAFASTFRLVISRRNDLGTSLNLMTLATALLLAVDIYFDIPHLIFCYLLPIFCVAIQFGRVPALLATTVSCFCAALFLYEPQLSLSVDDSLDRAELASFGLIATLISYFFGARSRYFEFLRL